MSLYEPGEIEQAIQDAPIFQDEGDDVETGEEEVDEPEPEEEAGDDEPVEEDTGAEEGETGGEEGETDEDVPHVVAPRTATGHQQRSWRSRFDRKHEGEAP